MGKRGPHALPPEVQKSRGTERPDRRRDKVGAKKACPPMPSWISDDARPCWKHIAPWLDEVGLLTRLDQVALTLLCDAVAHYINRRKAVEQSGWTSVSEKGGEYQHPNVGAMNKAREAVVKLLREFGMSPSARAGLAIANREAERDPMADLLQRIANARSEN